MGSGLGGLREVKGMAGFDMSSRMLHLIPAVAARL